MTRSAKRRAFGASRRKTLRSYRKVFVVAAEGRVTECQYFNHLNNTNAVVHVKCLRKGDKNAPLQVLASMQRFLKTEGLRAADEAWIVVDTDRWSSSDLQTLHDWSASKPNHALAVSNPKFEYWLLLHFEDGNRVASAAVCDRRLKGHLPAYDKGIDTSKFPTDRIRQAIGRAQRRDNPPCTDWPHKSPGTTVYRLAERILDAE